jgi:hypothetical protein
MERNILLNNIARAIHNAETDATRAGRLLSIRNALAFANKLAPSEFKGLALSKIFKAMNWLRSRAGKAAFA